MGAKSHFYMAFQNKDSLSDRIQFSRCARSGVPLRIPSFERGYCVFNASKRFLRIRFRQSGRTCFSPGMRYVSHMGAPFFRRVVQVHPQDLD